MSHPNEYETLARTLEQSQDYRVLRRLAVTRSYGNADGRPVKIGLILDTETTGLDPTDAVIELGILRFEFDPISGKVFRIVDSYSAYEDPGVPISPSAQAVHGITANMILGQRFDDASVKRVTDGADLVIAHNARFDRPMIEKRYSLFAHLNWACTYQEIDWKGAGFGSSSLEFIAYKYGFFYDAHGAMMDCRAVLEILHRSAMDRDPLLTQLVTACSRIEERIWAINAPYDRKDLMKERGYRWNNDNPKSWWISVNRKNAFEERRWLLKNVYQSHTARMRIDVIDASARYSLRLTDSKVRQISLNEPVD